MSDFDVSLSGTPPHGVPGPAPSFENLLEGARAPETEDEMSVVALTTALRAPARPDELASLDSDVAAFGNVRREARTATAAVVPLESRRSRRPAVLAAAAVAGVAASVLFVGTAAAALTGSLPAPLQRVAHNLVGAPEPEADSSTPPAAGPSAGVTYPATVGLCRAFRERASADPSMGAAAYAALASAASAQGLGVADFCAVVLAPAAEPTGASVSAPPATRPGQSGKRPAPPGQTIRPTVPPGQTKKPTAPPGQTKKATAPPGLTKKPTAPPGSTKKPTAPPGQTGRPSNPR